MHNGALRKMSLALTFWLALHVSALRAQIFTAPLQAYTTGTDPVDFEFRADGTLIAMGNLGVGSLLSGDQGAGTRMLWFPDLSAFRAGTVSGTQWDAVNIGQYSTAFGENNTASGVASTALGGYNTASGYGATALGGFNTASGEASTSTGIGNLVSQEGANTFGSWNVASGYEATAIGEGNIASGAFSTASGYYTQSQAMMSFVIGTYNTGGGSVNAWVAADPLFEIGNGTATTPSDALIVYKNGDAVLQGDLSTGGVITAQPGGDIPMYSGE